MHRQSHCNRRARRGIGIFLAAVLVTVVAGPVAVLRAEEPATQAAQKDQPPTAASKPAVDTGKKDLSDRPPQLRFLAWQAEGEDEDQSYEIPAAWTPNGERVNDEAVLKALRRTEPGHMGGAPGETWRYLHFWFSHPDFDRSAIANVTILNAAGKEISSSGNSWSSTPRGERENPDDSGWAVVTRGAGKTGDDLPKTVDIVLRYSLGPWEEIGTLNGVFEGPVKLDGVTVEEAEETTLDQAAAGRTGDGKVGDVRTTLRTVREYDVVLQMQFEVLAVMFDGRELTPSRRSSGTSPGEGEKARFQFYAPQSEIKLFKFRTRPIREVTFKNVSLGPDTTATPATNPTTKPAK